MRHVDHRCAQAGEQGLELRPHALAQQRVQIGKRLVEEAEARAAHQRAPQRHALLLAPRELSGAPPEELEDAERARDLAHARAHLLARNPSRLEREREIPLDGEVGVEGVVLEHEAHAAPADGNVVEALTVQEEAPRAGLIESRNDPQQRGLAAARRAEQREHAPGTGHERDVVERPRAVGEDLRQLGHPQLAHRYPLIAPRVSPETMRRSKSRTRPTSGAVAMTTAAESCPHGIS